MKKPATPADHKTKKYQQLQSSVFGGGYVDGAPVEVNREAGKAAFGTAADWKTSAAMAKPVNTGPSKTDTFLQRQKQLASNVFEQTDYSGFRPMKKHGVDEDNFGHQHKV